MTDSKEFDCIVYLNNGTNFRCKMQKRHIENMKEVACVKRVVIKK